MLNLTYLALLEPGEDGCYGISFPDIPGCFSFADNLAEAEQMAAEAAELHIYGMERDGEAIPEPSTSLSKDITKDMLVMPVTVHPDLYRMKRDNERVKTNITLPAWLKRMAEEKKVNYVVNLEETIIIIKGVPAKVCTECGEQYFDNETSENIEKIVNQLKQISTEVTIVNYKEKTA